MRKAPPLPGMGERSRRHNSFSAPVQVHLHHKTTGQVYPFFLLLLCTSFSFFLPFHFFTCFPLLFSPCHSAGTTVILWSHIPGALRVSSTSMSLLPSQLDLPSSVSPGLESTCDLKAEQVKAPKFCGQGQWWSLWSCDLDWQLHSSISSITFCTLLHPLPFPLAA